MATRKRATPARKAPAKTPVEPKRNRGGRPVGSKTKVPRPILDIYRAQSELLFEYITESGAAARIMSRMVDQAEAGDNISAGIVLDRLLPRPKGQTQLPKLKRFPTGEGVTATQQASYILNQMSNGYASVEAANVFLKAIQDTAALQDRELLMDEIDRLKEILADAGIDL